MPREREIPPTTLDELRRNLERLKLHAMLTALDKALEQAATLEQGYVTFLAGLVGSEVLAQAEAAAARRIKTADFDEPWTFDTFDWTFQPGLNVQLVKDLMNLHFIRQARPVLVLGRPGTGKTHLSIAYGHLACLAGYSVRFFTATKLLGLLYAALADATVDRLVARLAKVDLLIIDDLRHLPPKPEYASLFFDLVDARHSRKSTILSSNLSVDAWGKVLGNPTLTAPLVDRLMDRAHVINIKRGRSYRTEGPDATPVDDRPAGIESTDAP
jgi:DNA replication protein DnaC